MTYRREKERQNNTITNLVIGFSSHLMTLHRFANKKLQTLTHFEHILTKAGVCHFVIYSAHKKRSFYSVSRTIACWVFFLHPTFQKSIYIVPSWTPLISLIWLWEWKTTAKSPLTRRFSTAKTNIFHVDSRMNRNYQLLRCSTRTTEH